VDQIVESGSVVGMQIRGGGGELGEGADESHVDSFVLSFAECDERQHPGSTDPRGRGSSTS